MLAPVIATTPPPGKRTGRRAELFDCGKHGMLSKSQIAALAGISYHGVTMRIRAGWKGAQLCLPQGKRPSAKRGEVRYPTMLAAITLARRFRNRVPTVEELRKAKPMSLHAARRWQAALRRAIEDEQMQEDVEA